MPLAVCSDLSPADWIVASEVTWGQLATFGPAGFAAYVRVRFIPDPTREGQRARLIWTHRPTRSTSGGLCCSYSPQAPRILTIAISVSGTAGGSRDQHGNGPPSVFPAAPESLCGPTFCSTGHSQRPRLGPGARPQTLGSGAYRSSREAAHRRSSGRLTTRGVSPRTSTHTGQRSALPCH